MNFSIISLLGITNRYSLKYNLRRVLNNLDGSIGWDFGYDSPFINII